MDRKTIEAIEKMIKNTHISTLETIILKYCSRPHIRKKKRTHYLTATELKQKILKKLSKLKRGE